jgi:nucleotide-binding universal stress UspA family protein
MILVCYDGSADARAAVERAARLFPDEPATVLTVWEPFVEVVARTTVGPGLVATVPDADEIDQASSKEAERTAAEGAELASNLGMTALSRSCAQGTTTARAILAEADRLGAEAIVMGSRGLTGVKSLLLGSVSHEVIQHADRTVVVVPSPDVATSRAREVRRQEDSALSGQAASNG